jgi:hypothetical protein
MYEARSSALLGEFGKEHGSPFLKRRELGQDVLCERTSMAIRSPAAGSAMP